MISTKKRVVGIGFITGAAILGDAMLFIVLPLYWREFGLTAVWQIGVLLSINRFIRLPVNPLVGLFYKHFTLRVGMLLAIFLAVASTFSYGMLQEFWLLLIMRALWGVAWSLLRIGGFLTIIEVTKDNDRGRFVGLYNGIWGMGSLAGMLAGGLLVDITSILFVSTLFATAGLVGIPAALMLVPATKGEGDTENVKAKAKGFRWLTPYLGMVLLTGAAAGFIVMGLFSATLSLLIERAYVKEWSLFEITIGAATIAGSIQAIKWAWEPALAPWIGRKLDVSASPIRILLIPLIFGGAVLILLGNVTSIYLLLFLLLIFQVLSTVFMTSADTLATGAASRSYKVRMVTSYTIAVDFGAALGPLIAFMMIDMFGLPLIYNIAGIMLIAFGCLWIYMSRFAGPQRKSEQDVF